VTWDVWFGKEYMYDVHGITNQKTWQFGSPRDRINTEVRMRYEMATNRAPGSIALIDGRKYPGARLADGSHYAIGPNVTAYNTLAPQVGTFAVRPETWTRLFAYFKAPAASAGWWEYSLWAADAQTGPVRLFDGLQIKPSDAAASAENWQDFWLEYNTSCSIGRCNRPNRPTLVAYARNVVMLQGVDDVTPLLQRP
jgi:hypothetical protein